MIRKDVLYKSLILIPASVLVLGCGSGSPQTGASMSDMAAQVESSPQPEEAQSAKNEPAPPTKPPEEPTVVTAKTPKKGKSLHDQGSYLSAVGSARFRIEHEVTFGTVKKNLDLYRARTGHYPKSHEEFMTEIIEKGLIRLPALEEGYEYWYDTEDNLLKQRPIPTDE